MSSVEGIISIKIAWGKYIKTGCSFIRTRVLYWLLNKIPGIKKYTLRDREDITV